MKKKNQLHLTIDDIRNNGIRSTIVDDERREVLQSSIIYGAFAFVGFGMSVINIITGRIPLLISTASFFLLCAIDLILALSSKRGLKIANNLFMIEVGLLFSFFIVTGGTDNFSVIWLLLLPTVGLFFFGIKKGTIMCAIIMVIMLLFFHVPFFNQFCTDYGDSFRLRFPAVFLSSYIIGFFLEYIRVTTAEELNKLRYQFEFQSNHDVLTGLLNRYGENESLKMGEMLHAQKMCIAMLDIDHFKVINDTYGHGDGDLILKQLSNLVLAEKVDKSVFYRWGGEEFFITYYNFDEALLNVEKILSTIRTTEFRISGDRKINITVSMGLTREYKVSGKDEYEKLMMKADACLYEAKETGRNRIVVEKR